MLYKQPQPPLTASSDNNDLHTKRNVLTALAGIFLGLGFVCTCIAFAEDSEWVFAALTFFVLSLVMCAVRCGTRENSNQNLKQKLKEEKEHFVLIEE
jgi:hypothetical protein